MPFIASLHTQLPDTGQPPEWVHLLPAGQFRGADGRGPYRVDDAAAVIAASVHTANGAPPRLVIDESHATDHSLRTGAAAPARGWVTELQARADGIWGRVEWTRTGAELMTERAYRGISPVFIHDKASGQVRQLLRAGLTNAPNLGQLATLHTQQDPSMDLAQQLRAALGLPDTADEPAIVAAATTARAAVAAHAQQLGAIATAVGVAADADAGAVLTALQTQAAAATDAGRMAAEMVALQAQVTELRNGAARERATAALDRAAAEGKPIPATLREHYIARHMREPQDVEKEIASMPSLHTGGLAGRAPVPPAGAGQAGLTGDEASLCAMMSLDPAAFAKTKAGQIVASATGGVG